MIQVQQIRNKVRMIEQYQAQGSNATGSSSGRVDQLQNRLSAVSSNQGGIAHASQSM